MSQFKILIGAAIIIFLVWGIVAISFNQTDKTEVETPPPALFGGISDNAAQAPLPETNLITNQDTMPVVKIKTSKGDITLEFFPADAPKTVENFTTLAKKGFYDGVIFHRVISGFMIQGGDPTGTGSGGPGYQFADELNPQAPSYQNGYTRGTVAMANAGPNTNGSQFFIMHKDTSLPHAYTIFGRVISGMEVVDAIAAEKVNSNNRPLVDVVMTIVEVVE